MLGECLLISRLPGKALKSKYGCKDQESIQSSTTPDPGYQWESDRLTVDTTNESKEVSPFPEGDHKAHINRRAQRHSNTRQNKNIKDPLVDIARLPFSKLSLVSLMSKDANMVFY